MDLLWTLGFSLLASAGGVSAAALFLLLPLTIRQRLLPYFISFATGTLLTSALLKLLPHALEEIGARTGLSVLLGGLGLFFLLERLLIWRHCHVEGHCETHSSSGTLILIGDGFHNFVDGVIIAVAFLTSIPLGIATGLAIIAHEIPQEVGDFAVLLESGFGRAQAFLWNLVSGSMTIMGAVGGVLAFEDVQFMTPYILSLSAAGFLYIGLADLVPGLHKRLQPGIGTVELLFLLLGSALIILIPGH